MEKLTGGKIVVKTLEELKVDTVFGIPGIHNLDIYDALLESNIKHVTARHEQGIGYMADGYARITGKPGVALVITGPGLTNILTAMGEAYHDSIPMVVISSQIPTWALGQRIGFLHELKNSTILAKSVTKESRTVLTHADIPSYIKEAYELANSGRPGPVHVEIPLDILQESIDEEYIDFFINVPKKNTPFFDFDEQILLNVLNEVNRAKKPVLIVGGGGWRATKEIINLAETISAPVIQTAAGKGIMDETHPLCIGTRIHFPIVREYLQNSDLVIAVGTELSPTDLWEMPLEIGGKLIQIDLDAANFNRNYPADIGLKGDARYLLNNLINKIKKERQINPQVVKKVTEMKNNSRKQLSEVTGVSEDLEIIKDMLQAIRSQLPNEGILFTDMTTPAYIGLSEFTVYQPRTYIHPVGFGTLGFALPAAIGAKIAEPQRAICVLAGDGGFQFTMPELAVACSEKISLPIIIWNDNGFGEIRRNEEARHPGQRIAVDHENPDFINLAKAYGIKGRVVRSPEELKDTLQQAFKEEKPMFIEIKV